MGSLSPVHWLIVMVVVMLLFGPAALKSMGKGLGEGLRSFKKGLNEDLPDEAPPRPAEVAENRASEAVSRVAEPRDPATPSTARPQAPN
jgi:sec-independent protein translocase protein TatA